MLSMAQHFREMESRDIGTQGMRCPTTTIPTLLKPQWDTEKCLPLI